MQGQMQPSTITVLVTGGSGFVGSHVIIHLLRAGYQVRTTIRDISREHQVRNLFNDAGAESNRLSFFAADLTKDEGWNEAVKDCDYVMHVASPFPAETPKHEDELILPARDGTIRVLRAAREARVKRVVLTSSFAAIGYGQAGRKDIYTENDWSILDRDTVPAYHKSKTLAERAAWEFIEKEGGDLELTVINPVGIFGPVLGKDFSASIQIIQKLMDGRIPGCPQIYFSVVDVRDLADLHLLAMIKPEAKGERFIGVSSDKAMSFLDIATIIRENRPENASKVPTRQFPNWIIRVLAMFDPNARQLVPQLGEIKKISNEKAKNQLGWKPRSANATILDTADSLIKHKIV